MLRKLPNYGPCLILYITQIKRICLRHKLYVKCHNQRVRSSKISNASKMTNSERRHNLIDSERHSLRSGHKHNVKNHHPRSSIPPAILFTKLQWSIKNRKKPDPDKAWVRMFTSSYQVYIFNILARKKKQLMNLPKLWRMSILMVNWPDGQTQKCSPAPIKSFDVKTRQIYVYDGLPSLWYWRKLFAMEPLSNHSSSDPF